MGVIYEVVAVGDLDKTGVSNLFLISYFLLSSTTSESFLGAAEAATIGSALIVAAYFDCKFTIESMSADVLNEKDAALYLNSLCIL